LRIHIDQEKHSEEVVPKIHEILRGYPGNMEVSVFAGLETGEQVQIAVRRHRVSVTPELRGRLDDLLGPDSHRLLVTPPKPKQGGGEKRFRRE
jgi:DNA polymerase-3 subunit alpha